jgi:signal transduction histidine kinase/DNA-binding response OmpR family regulator/ligand-binding sensor domain-containing protein
MLIFKKRKLTLSMGDALKLLYILCCFSFFIEPLTAQGVGSQTLTPRKAIGKEVLSDHIKPPRVSTLQPPIIIQAKPPQIIRRTTRKRPIGPARSASLPISKTLIPGQEGFDYPTIHPLTSQPFLARAPEKVLAHQPRKKNTGSLNILSYDLSNGLKDNNVGRIYQDPQHHLWGTTAYGGVFKFDGKYFHWFSEAQGLTNNTSGLLFTNDEEIWFGSINGITQYDGKYMTNYTTEHGLVNNWVLNCDKDKYGHIWMSSIKALQMINSRRDSVYVFSRDNGLLYDVALVKTDRRGNLWVTLGEKYFIIIVPEKKQGKYIFQFKYFLQDIGSIMKIYEDQHGNIWLGSSDGVFEVSNITDDYDQMRFTQYEKGIPNLSEQYITGIEKDEEGSIWVTTRDGLYLLEPGSDQSPAYATRLTAPEDIPKSIVGSIFRDDQHNIWMGCGGLSMIRKTPFHIFEGIKAPTCIVEDQQKNIWVGSAQGLYRYDPDQPDRVVLFTTEEGLPEGRITDLMVDSKGRIWMAIIGFGVSIFKPQPKGNSGTFSHYPLESGIPSIFPTTFFEDKNGDTWSAFYTNPVDTKGGIAKIKGNKLTFIGKPQGLMNEDIMAMDMDTFGQFWIGSWGEGINKYEPDAGNDKGKTTYYSSRQIPMENRVRTVQADRRGNVWVGGYGGGGITQFLTSPDDKTDQVRHYSEAHGLSSGTLLSALEDTDGNLWFGTAYGLNLLPADQVEQPSSLSPIISYTEADGFPAKACEKNVLFQSSDGLIWVGGDQRLMYFDPKELIAEPDIPSAQLIAVSLFNQPISWEKDTAFVLADGKKVGDFDFDSLSYFNHLPQNLSLSHRNNFIDFDYVGISIDQAHKIQYQTQLKGLENGWSTPTADAKISYNGLRHGTYVFKVRARIANGAWGPPLEYAFRIRTPWWLSSWAYGIYALLGAASLFIFYRFQLKRRLDKAEAIRLIELNATQNRLYTNITHEFRTPLTVISGMAAQVREKPKEWFHDGIDMIERNANRLLVLVNQLLDISKLESGKLTLKMYQGDVISYLKYIVESISSLAESKQIQVHLQAEEKELVMDFDPDKLQQVIVNLLSNAVKFTPEEGRIEVIVKKLERMNQTGIFQHKPALEIVVKDTGPGIPEKQLPFIFDRFYQVDDSSTRPEEGTGIGLALVKELLKLMEGAITVKSQLGKGTAFTATLPICNQASTCFEPEEVPISLPLAEPIPSLKDASPLLKEKQEAMPFHSSKPRILLIEDNLDVIKYIEAVLQNNYAVQVGKNGQEGIEIAIETGPDLIITDVMMPYKDGFEVCQTLKKDERTSHIPIIMLTAKADIESKLEGLECGADAYLAKPFHKKELRIRVKKLLELRNKLQRYHRSLISSSNVETVLKEVSESAAREHHFVKKVRAVVEMHLDNVDFSVEQFCREVGMSSSHLHRKLKALTGLSPNKFIRYVRLHKAKVLLKSPDVNITDVAYSTGFNDPSYFTRVFKKEFSMTPMEWKKTPNV